MVSIFDKPGLLFGVWGVCALTQFAVHNEVDIFPGWWEFATFIGAILPIIALVLGAVAWLE